MRDFAKIPPTFWISPAYKKLKEQGSEAVVVAFYLLTGPHSNMIGLYYLPLVYIAHETGLPLEGAKEGLRRVVSTGFCEYDPLSEVVWIPEMASMQLGVNLKPADNMCKGIQNTYDGVIENPYLSSFYEYYSSDYHLKNKRVFGAENAVNLEGSSKGLRSKETETEKETEKETKQVQPKMAAGRFDVFAIELPVWLPADLWVLWVNYRIERKPAIRTHAEVSETFSALAEMHSRGVDVEMVIRRSIANGWQGLFDPAGNGSASNPLIDFGASMNRLLGGMKPGNESEALAWVSAQAEGIRGIRETQAVQLWTKHLSAAYAKTGEQPYTGA